MAQDLQRAWSDYSAALNKQLQGWDRTGIILQMRESCWYNFPDPLDIRDDGYSNTGMYVLSGLYEFVMLAGTATSVFGFATALQYFERFRHFSPADLSFGLLRVLLFLTFTWRFTQLWHADCKHLHRFRDLRWATTRGLLVLSVILAPDWFWYSTVMTVYQNSGPNFFSRWYLKNANFLSVLALSMRWGRLDGMSFRELWFSTDGTNSNSTESVAPSNKWDNLKASAAAGFYRVVAENPSLLLVLATAIAVAICQVVKAVGIAVFVLTKEPMAYALQLYSMMEGGAVIYRDCFAELLVDCLLNVWRPLQTLGLGRFTATLWTSSLFWVKILLFVSFSALRLVYYLHQAIGMFILQYFLRGVFYLFRMPIPSTADPHILTSPMPSSWPSKIIRFFGVVMLECFCRLLAFVFRIPIPSPTASTSSSKLSKTTHIRLIEIEPSLFGFGPVVSSLKWYNLNYIPSYTAISYVWGSSTPNSDIRLNGKEYWTTDSASQALTNLRSRWRRRRFWIDAICIDQASTEDKAEQISNMAEIYRRAAKVIVWLGPDKDARLAFALARRLLLGTRQQLSESDALRCVQNASEGAWSSLQRLMSNPWFERSWVMQEVLHENVVIRYGNESMRWTQFSMFAMAISSEIDVCAKLDDIDQSSQRGIGYGMTARTSRQSISYIRVFQDFRALNLHQAASDHLSLLFYLVRMFRADCKFQTTETKDRIYSLVNMCGLADRPQFRSDFRPSASETLTASALFSLVARHLLHSDPRERRLDLLSHAGIGNLVNVDSASSLPSWVPDWSVRNYPCLPLIGQDGTHELLHHPQLKAVLRNVADLTMYDVASGKHLHEQTPVLEKVLSDLEQSARCIREKTLYRATRTTLPKFSLHPHPMQLLDVAGRHLDSIKVLGPTFPRLSSDDVSGWSAREADLKRVAVVIDRWMALLGSDLQRRMVGLGRVLIGDLSYPSCDFLSLSTHLPVRPAPKEKILKVMDYMSVILRLLQYDSLESALLVREEITARYQPENVSKEVRLKDIMETDAHIRKMCAGRRFGITNRGTMGLFPQGTKAVQENQGIHADGRGIEHAEARKPLHEDADHVCLIYGTAIPFVLRKSHHQSENDGQNSPSSPGNGGFVERWQLVGPAYLQGFMDGEGLKDDFPEAMFQIH